VWILRVYHSQAAVATLPPLVSPLPSILRRFLPPTPMQVPTYLHESGRHRRRIYPCGSVGSLGHLCMSVPLVTRSAATSSTVMQIGNPPTQLHRCSPNHACTEAHAVINVSTASNSRNNEDDAIIYAKYVDLYCYIYWIKN